MVLFSNFTTGLFRINRKIQVKQIHAWSSLGRIPSLIWLHPRPSLLARIGNPERRKTKRKRRGAISTVLNGPGGGGEPNKTKAKRRGPPPIFSLYMYISTYSLPWVIILLTSSPPPPPPPISNCPRPHQTHTHQYQPSFISIQYRENVHQLPHKKGEIQGTKGLMGTVKGLNHENIKRVIFYVSFSIEIWT
jgi:hypothetical protein